MTIEVDCPILRRASNLGTELKRNLRRLDKTLEVCTACAFKAECETIEQVREWVRQAARDVLDELGG